MKPSVSLSDSGHHVRHCLSASLFSNTKFATFLFHFVVIHFVVYLHSFGHLPLMMLQIKVKCPVCLIKLHAVKEYGGIEV
jgi:hypothetical protein